MKHLKFIARTVLVENNQVDQAVKALNRVLSNEKVIDQFKRWQYYEKPFERRNRLSFQKCAEIYGGEVERKVKFIVRKNRENPYPWD
jgi:small subunit ribosomal protein S21